MSKSYQFSPSVDGKCENILSGIDIKMKQSRWKLSLLHEFLSCQGNWQNPVKRTGNKLLNYFLFFYRFLFIMKKKWRCKNTH